jgi:hypothetical protein
MTSHVEAALRGYLVGHKHELLFVNGRARPFSRVACASIRGASDTVGVVHQPLEVFDERPFVVA